MFTIALLVYVFLLFALLTGGRPSQGYHVGISEKARKGYEKKKRDAARARAEGQVHETEVNVAKSLDARPRKVSSLVRGKTVLPWKQ